MSHSSLTFECLEQRRVLTAALPDIFAWADQARGYLYDYQVEGNLLRFSTAIANSGAGPLEIVGGNPLPNGNQEVIQRIYDDQGNLYQERVAGEFTYHPSHGHIHFDGYAVYNLREQDHTGNPGDIVATGGKISFCLIDIVKYDPNAGPLNYTLCEATVQGVSAGWSDVYHRTLPDQWINISGISDGDYFLEIIVDPDDQLLESDETNNTTIIPITLAHGPGTQGDAYEPNNSFGEAFDFGPVSNLHHAGMSIHIKQDLDFYKFTATDDGEINAQISFPHALGDLNLTVYDANQTVIGSSDTSDDFESVSWIVNKGSTYFLHVDNAPSVTNGYELMIDGPGDFGSIVASSSDPALPAVIPDGQGPGTPGASLFSNVVGPDIVLTDVNLVVDDLVHGYLGDLHIELTSPSGTTATLIRSRFESPAGGLGSENNFLGTILDDQSQVSLVDGSAPFTGRFNVNHSSVDADPLSVFIGENAAGSWTLKIEDWYNADQGTLSAWGIEFTGNLGDRLETNDFFPQATDLGVVGSAFEEDLSIHTGSDRDYFRLLTDSSGALEVEAVFDAADGDIQIALYDDQLTQVALASSQDSNELLRYPVQGGALYYVEVFSEGTDVAFYDFSVRTRLLGDFDGDSLVTTADIDLLRDAILANSMPWAFDLTGDGVLTEADLDAMVLDVIGTLYGDANLDFVVNGLDFVAWNNNKFQAGGWAEGNFTLDGDVDGLDFVRWNDHKFSSPPAARIIKPAQLNSAAEVLHRDVHEEEAELSNPPQAPLAIRPEWLQTWTRQEERSN